MDIAKFLQASLAPRTAQISTPELAEWGAEHWTVRGLTAAQLAVANEAASTGLDNIKAMITALAGGEGDKAEAFRKAMGIAGDSPPDLSRRIEMLVAGSVEPDIKQHRDVAVKLAENFPTVFYKLTNEILSLTGKGSEGKRKPSGQTRA